MRNLVFIGVVLSLLTARLWAQSSPQLVSSPQGASEPAILQLGKPIEREMGGGETHSYRIHVEAGQFVHAVVLQKGIDVAVRLLDPGGKEMAKMNSMNGAYGPEPVSAIAAISGDFRLEVTAGGAARGRYEVQVTDLHPPTQADRTRIEAERVYMEGMGLWSQGNAQSYKAAVEKFQESFTLWQSLDDKYGQALSLYSSGKAFNIVGEREKALQSFNPAVPLFRAVADRDGEAATLVDIGQVYDKLGERQKALDYYAQALPVFRDVGDRAHEADTLTSIGGAYSALGEQQKALELLSQSLTIQHAVGDRVGEGKTLQNMGIACFRLGQWRKALDYWNQALPVFRAVGDQLHEAGILSNIGAAWSYLGEEQKALDYYKQALPIRRAVGDRPGEAATLNNIGLAYYNLRELQKALESYEQALPIFRAVGDRPGEAATLSNIGAVNIYRGEHQKALDYFKQALPIERSTGDRAGEARTLLSIGGVYIYLGDQQKALEYLNEALPIARAVGSRDLEAATLINIGLAYYHLKENQKAADYYNQALSIERSIGDRAAEADTLNNIGSIYSDLGEYQRALEYFNQALPIERSIGDRAEEAETLNNIGSVYSDLGEHQKALDDYGQALSLFQAVQDPLGEALTLLDLMNYWKALDRPSLAIYFGKQGIDRFQQVRRNILGLPKEEQQSFLSSNESSYRQLADLMIQQGRLSEAEEVLDLLKLEEYADFSHRRAGKDSPFQPVTRTRAEQLAQQAGDPLQADLTALGQQWLELKRKSVRTAEEQRQYDQLSQKLDTANERWKKYLDGLYEDFGKGDQANKSVASVKAESSGLRNLLRGMNAGTVAVYTLVLDQKCVLMVITPAVMVAREVPISQAALRSKVFAFVRALAELQSEQNFLPRAQDLYRILLAPIEKDLEQAQANTLLWSLDDVLRYVPLAALHDGKQYLVERFPNVVITTTSVGNFTPPQVAAWRGAAMGVSKDYDGLGELKAVPGELGAVVTSAAIKGSHGPLPGTIMLDDTFTEKNLEAALEQPPPLLHLATHFIFNPGDDERSYLLLGGKEEGGQGYHLSLADLRNEPRLNNLVGVELLTLSGCETAMGSKDSDGREVDSLGIVGQLNGAKAVVATLWKVDDVSVGMLMETFYRLWITPPGMTKSEALRKAQVALLHGASPSAGSGSGGQSANQTAPYSNPYYWAPFVLIGNWK